MAGENATILSYSLYGTKSLYFQNIPFLVIANDLLFPGFRQVYFVHRGSTGVPTHDVLRACHEAGKVDLRHYDGEIGKTNLKLHRMSPLWEESTEYLFPRELDSMPTSHEARAVRVFIASGLAVHMLRGSEQHTTLMAGLSGFRRPPLLPRIPPTFEEFCRDCPSTHDDQLLLKKVFIRHPMDYVLDTPVCRATSIPWSTGVPCSEEELGRVNLSSVPQEFLVRMDRDAAYPGAVTCVSRGAFTLALEMGSEVSGIVRASLPGARLDAYLSSIRP